MCNEKEECGKDCCCQSEKALEAKHQEMLEKIYWRDQAARWTAFASAAIPTIGTPPMGNSTVQLASRLADEMLEEFNKRFPKDKII